MRDSSGAVLRTVSPGTGATPTPDARVKVRYRGEAGGAVFADSAHSATKGGPETVPLTGTIPCWQTALLRMRVGERARLVCPWYTTFEKKAVPAGVPRNVTVAFDLELLDVESAVAAAAAKVRGLEKRILREGDGDSPSESDRVKVHYEGRLADGTVFDSSIRRGEPAVFPLTGVIPCWTALIPKMKVGEKAELHCPAALAYGPRGQPPEIPPNADLTFEVELLAIEK